MTTTSADPDDLVLYTDAAGDGSTRITTAAAELRGALDAFRASEGRAVFIADVPEVDLDLSFLSQRWSRLAGWLDQVARAFAAADGGDGGTLTLDDTAIADTAGRFRPPEVEYIERDGRLILDTGGGADAVVLADEGDEILVNVNGSLYRFDVAGDDLVIVRGGSGADRIGGVPLVGGPTRDGLVLDGGSGDDLLAVRGGDAVLRGGAGNDRLQGGDGADRLLGGAGDDVAEGGVGDDRILGGDGDDVIDGQAGDDWVSAGAGEDLVYGGIGDDLLTGGEGRDHVDGGVGVDHVEGGAADDIVSGGAGHDTVDGGSGSDVSLGGPGHDLVTGGSGADRMTVEGRDTVGDATDDDTVRRREIDLSPLTGIHIAIDGPLGDRVRADLVTLAATATGARLLESLRGREVLVVGPGSLPQPGDSYERGRDLIQYDTIDDQAGFGPAGAHRPWDSLSFSPLVALGHELIHASHDLNGTRTEGVYRGTDDNQLDTNRDGEVSYAEGEDEWGRPLGDQAVSNEERATVGLPVDPDEDPSTPDVPAAEVHPDIVDATENDLRDELGVERRGRY